MIGYSSDFVVLVVCTSTKHVQFSNFTYVLCTIFIKICRPTPTFFLKLRGVRNQPNQCPYILNFMEIQLVKLQLLAPIQQLDIFIQQLDIFIRQYGQYSTISSINKLCWQIMLQKLLHTYIHTYIAKHLQSLQEPIDEIVQREEGKSRDEINRSEIDENKADEQARKISKRSNKGANMQFNLDQLKFGTDSTDQAE
eukprot:TRINITY_DN17327_c0_g1_i2.p2 TRINITY_DN17327_c0_g1~~TRINITY_DN17327_c0_g1_i2.p2  ORF type:complete len:196 (-),score=-2.77 TRINITY_DN17327_c0_g1_i2:849-1436(-)